MVCFLSCFGCTKKRKRPKCCTKIISSNQVHGKYVPLDSDITSQIQHTQKSNIPGSPKKEKKKENSSTKVKKKVSFNLDVKTYEPLNYDDGSDDIVNFSEGEEETKWEFNEEETQRATMVGWHHDKHKVASYRYQNIQDFYDEDDETMLGDSDLDDDMFDGDDEESCDISNDGDEDEDDRTIINDHQVTTGRRYTNSVLNPVENLTQWKAIKAKESLQRRRQKQTIISEQENQAPQETTPNFSQLKNLQQEISVNTSLASWLLQSTENPITKL